MTRALSTPSRAALARVHVLAKQAGLDDEAYRDFLERETGKRSARNLSDGELRLVCEKLGRPSGVRPAAVYPAAAGPYAGKLRALWISAWHLGVVRDRSDAAMIAFVKRQTRVEHTRFLIEAQSANKAIEGLKAWLARAAGVDWGDETTNPRRAVVEAQVRRLEELGDVKPGYWQGASFLEDYVCKVTGKSRGLAHLDAADWDRAIAALGGRLRRALAKAATRGG
ncbi:MAG: regulatory protein GemA [Hyphomicrobiaceae bacterium]|nr:regulatory protein GemA [Hyphomicrobiaceae bacterium]